MKELELFKEKFFEYFRMSREQFLEILFKVTNDLMMHYHSRSDVISPHYDKFAILPEKKARRSFSLVLRCEA